MRVYILRKNARKDCQIVYLFWLGIIYELQGMNYKNQEV